MSSCNDVVLQPRSCRNMNGLGYSPFARHYWGNHCYFLFLQVLRCFTSLRTPRPKPVPTHDGRWVPPFGNPRIKGYLHLPGAYRSLSRPSSPPRAKASAMRPCLLSLFIRPHLRVSGMIYTFSSLLLKLLFACTICHRSVIFVSYVSDGVENNGFEPLTLCVQGRCSSQLS